MRAPFAIHAALSLGLTVLAGCKPDVLVVLADNHPTVNLFGFEESQLHHIHNTVELRRNIFLVRYDPKHPDALEWVNCPIPATYTYRQANGRRVESIHIKSFQDLQAKVPVNYARFAGYVKNGKELEFNYVTIGSYELLSDFKVPRNDPDCQRATHYVVTLSVGAFNFAEQKATEGGLEVQEANTGVGVGVGAGRSSGETTSMGDLNACMDDTAALNGCFTPLQLMMMPLAERNWTDDTTAASSMPAEQPQPSQGTGAQGGQAETQVATSLALRVDENAWRPGSYMAMALENLLLMATRINVTTEFGFDDMGSTVMAGYVTPEKPQKTARAFAGGKTYAVVGASAVGSNINLVIRDSSGNVVAADEAEDANPAVTFTPPADDNYSIELSLAGQGDDFGAVVVMQDGGLPISPEILQAVFQRLLDSGAFASQKIQEMGVPNGLLFNESQWAVQGTVLYPGEVIRQSGIRLDVPSVFLAVSHEESFNIDLEVIDANSGQSWADQEADSNPLVLVDQPNPDSSYDLRVIYGQGEGPTLATSLVLQVAP